MLLGILRTMRPHQWVKNLFVIAPLVFAQQLGDIGRVLSTAAAFMLFSLASSSVYILNDLADVEADRAHPVKRRRPIASGQVSEAAARAAGGGLITFALASGAALDLRFGGILLAYVVLNIAYTFKLKHVAYVDVLCIATGFEFRVLAGTFAASVAPTAYLLVVTFLLAAFLGFGKRMHELRQGDAGVKQRRVLQSYGDKTLGMLLYAAGIATVGTYVVYTLDPDTAAFFGTRWLGLSVPFTLFGVLRFLQLVRKRSDADSPTEQMLRDWPFLLNLVLWAVAVTVIIYRQ